MMRDEDLWPRRYVVGITTCGACRAWQIEYPVALLASEVLAELAVHALAGGCHRDTVALMATAADIQMTIYLSNGGDA